MNRALLFMLLCCPGCHSGTPRTVPLAVPALAEAVSRDSAQFAAVLDTLTAMHHNGVAPGVVAVPSGLNRISGSKNDRNTLTTRITAVRRSILVARGITILRDAATGKCPPVMIVENPGSRCPATNELRVTVSIASVMGAESPWGNPPLAKDETAMEVYRLAIGAGGYSRQSDQYVLKQVDGQWKVVRIINSYIM